MSTSDLCLHLLLQLCLRLEVETELKFRYVENALMAVNSVGNELHALLGNKQ